MQKFDGKFLTLECHNDSTKYTQYGNKPKIENSHLHRVIIQGSVTAPLVTVSAPWNVGSVRLPLKHTQPINFQEMNSFRLGFSREDVCDLELSSLEELMRQKKLSQPQINLIKQEREKLKRQKRKKRHKQKVKAEFIDLEKDVSDLITTKNELEKMRDELTEEIKGYSSLLCKTQLIVAKNA